MLYLIIIIGTTLSVALINILCNAFNLPWWYLLTLSIVSTLTVILIDGILAIVVHWFPKKWFSHENERFNVSKRETKFYERIGIRKWKELVPELGGLNDFHKDHIEKPSDLSYLEKYLLEINYGFVLHVLGAPFGFLIMLLDYKLFMGNGLTVGLTIALPIAIVNAILSLMPAFVLRYNYPRLQVLHKYAKRKALKKEEAKEDGIL